jgi:hypothetical protein
MHFDYLLVIGLLLFVCLFYFSPYDVKSEERDDDI